MPTVSRFFGIIIQMFWREHAPPHFHAMYGEHEALIDIRTLETIGGRLPSEPSPSPSNGLLITAPDGELETMSIQASTQADSAAGVTSSAPWRIKAFTVLPQHRLAVTFNDGLQGVADLSSVRTSSDCGVYEPLKEPQFFAQARLELGAVTWPNGADLDPAWLHEELSRSETWSVPI